MRLVPGAIFCSQVFFFYCKGLFGSWVGHSIKCHKYLATELKTHKYLATELKTHKYLATELKTHSYPATELKTHKYLATELKTHRFELFTGLNYCRQKFHESHDFLTGLHALSWHLKH